MTNPTPRDSAQLPPLRKLTEDELSTLHDNPNTSDVEQLVYDYAREALAAQAASVEPVGSHMTATVLATLLAEAVRKDEQGGGLDIGAGIFGHFTSELIREIASTISALPSPASVPGDVPSAMAVVCKALQDDPEYAWSWHCNIAMSAFDEGMGHYAANKAAARFLGLLAGVDTTKHPGFPPQHPAPSPTQAVDAVDELREALRMGVACLRNWKILHPEDFDDLDERAVALLKAALATKEPK